MTSIPFLLMAGVGFDADVVRRVDLARTGHITHFSYTKPILDSIRSYQYPELRIYSQDAADADQVELSTTARWAFVVNLPRYARGLISWTVIRGETCPWRSKWCPAG